MCICVCMKYKENICNVLTKCIHVLYKISEYEGAYLHVYGNCLCPNKG